MKKFSPKTAAGASAHCPHSAGFQTCRIADFQIGNAPKLQRHLNYSRFADLEIRDTADLEVGATQGRCADASPCPDAMGELGQSTEWSIVGDRLLVLSGWRQATTDHQPRTTDYQLARL